MISSGLVILAVSLVSMFDLAVNRTPGTGANSDTIYYYCNMPEWPDMLQFIEVAIGDDSGQKTGLGYSVVSLKETTISHTICTVPNFLSILQAGSNLGIIYYDGHASDFSILVERYPATVCGWSQALQQAQSYASTFGWQFGDVSSPFTEIGIEVSSDQDGFYIVVTKRFIEQLAGPLNSALVMLNASKGQFSAQSFITKGALSVLAYDYSPTINQGYQDFFYIIDNLTGGHAVNPRDYRQLFRAVGGTTVITTGERFVTLRPCRAFCHSHWRPTW